MKQNIQSNLDPVPKLEKGKRISLILLLLFAMCLSSVELYNFNKGMAFFKPLNMADVTNTVSSLETAYSGIGVNTFTQKDFIGAFVNMKVILSVVAFIGLMSLCYLFAKQSANKAVAQKESVIISLIAVAIPYLVQIIILLSLFGSKDFDISNIELYKNVLYSPLVFLFCVCSLFKIYGISLLINNNKHNISNDDMSWMIFLLIQVPIFSIIAVVKLVNSGLVTSASLESGRKIDYSPINKYAIGGIVYYILVLVNTSFF